MARTILLVALAAGIAYSIVAVGVAPAEQTASKKRARPARLHSDAARHDTVTTWANRTLAELRRVEQAKLAVHTNDHHWTFAGKLGKLPLKQRLRAYRIIVGHDSYVIHSAKTCHCPAVIARHLNERRHARAHIRKIQAKLHPPFSYPWWWIPLGRCETGVYPPDPAYGAPGHPGGDGYHGWINFAPSTWDTYKRYVPGASQYAYAYDAPEYVQYLVTMAMHNAGNPWAQSNPACSALIGLS